MKIVIPGIPVPQARIKHTRRAGFIGTYDPKAKEKEEIREWLFLNSELETCDNPRASFLFHMPIPKGIPKKLRPIYESGRLKHRKKPDSDNLIKLYFDCLDKIIIDGDEKVSIGAVNKVYHPEPKTVIWLHETTQLLEPWELDFAFLNVEEPEISSFYELDYLPYSYNLLKQVGLLSLHKGSLETAKLSLSPLLNSQPHRESLCKACP